MLAPLGDVTLEAHEVAGACLGGVLAEVVLPPTRADDREPDVGEPPTQRGDGIDGVLDLLVRDEPTHHGEQRPRRLGETRQEG